jgi:hypothetical protein
MRQIETKISKKIAISMSASSPEKILTPPFLLGQRWLPLSAILSSGTIQKTKKARRSQRLGETIETMLLRRKIRNL